MKLWKSKAGIQISSFSKFLYLIKDILAMRAFRIIHLGERCNEVTKQTSKSYMAEVSSKGKLVSYDAYFMVCGRFLSTKKKI